MTHALYGKLYSEGYDIGEERFEARAFYLQEWERRGRPMPLLEPMCGTGFFLIPLMEAGADIDGLDSSPHMLDICRNKCAGKGLIPRLYEQRLEVMALPRKYAFILIPDRSFAHVYTKDIAQTCLQQLSEYLLPGGWLIVDIKTPPKPGEFGAPGQTDFSVEDRPDGSTIFATSVWSEREAGRVIRNWSKYERYVQGTLTQVEIFDYNERFYDRAEFTEMLHLAGFATITAVKAYDGAEPAEHDVIVYICQKS
jgi:SAM-dependent methyltransferase